MQNILWVTSVFGSSTATWPPISYFPLTAECIANTKRHNADICWHTCACLSVMWHQIIFLSLKCFVHMCLWQRSGCQGHPNASLSDDTTAHHSVAVVSIQLPSSSWWVIRSLSEWVWQTLAVKFLLLVASASNRFKCYCKAAVFEDKCYQMKSLESFFSL